MIHTDSNIRDKDEGSAVVEFAIVIAFLAFILISAFDFGRMLCDYFIMSEIAWEGARASSMIPGLREPALLEHPLSLDEVERCAESIDDPFLLGVEMCALIVGRERMTTLIGLHSVSLVEGTERLSVTYTPEGLVNASVSGKYDALFPLYRLMTLQAEVSMPYLACMGSMEGRGR